MSERNKKVSIVLPVYNGEKMLAEAIESVIKQTYQNIELLIINDCSTDGTESIIDFYVDKDARVKKINNIQNMKLPASLNIGFQNATGDFWTWTSDDNKYKEEAIERMVDYLEKNRLACLVYSDYTVIDEAGNELYKRVAEEPKEMPVGNCVGACFLYRQEYAQKVGTYDVNLFLAEDYDYWIRLYKEGTICHLNLDLYFYRQHDKSLTATKKEMIGIQTYKVWEKHFLFLFSLIEKTNEKILFMDRMVYLSTGLGERKKQQTIDILCKVWPRYKLHTMYLAFRHNMKDTAIGRLLRKSSKIKKLFRIV